MRVSGKLSEPHQPEIDAVGELGVLALCVGDINRGSPKASRQRSRSSSSSDRVEHVNSTTSDPSDGTSLKKRKRSEDSDGAGSAGGKASSILARRVQLKV